VTGCGAPAQDLAAVDPGSGAVIQGSVVRNGSPVGGAYVRLLDAGGEFTAEVVSSASGAFRFFAAPGDWRVRALAPGGSGEVAVRTAGGEVAVVPLTLAS